MSFHIALKAPPCLQFLLAPCQPPPLKSLPLSRAQTRSEDKGGQPPLAPAACFTVPSPMLLDSQDNRVSVKLLKHYSDRSLTLSGC